ncbi:MAG: hypothetical protein DHS20C18_31210 [Saprospiraceae bacterium]|nr:MAG: hypothetical protein DHS20C18_31210 [Saprospiraceae bacterium]
MKLSTLLIALGLILCLTSCNTAEEELVLQEGEIHGDLHQANIGKITFMGDPIPIDEYTEKDFLTAFDLSDNVDLNIRVFLGKTLTYYLHELAPDLPVNELCKKGNYQFSFYVDNRLVYTENLNSGAGSCWYKNSMTLFRVPLLSTSEEDSWGRFMWMRFMKKEGGEEALSEGSHILKIEMRPYIETSELKVGNLIAEGQISLNIIKTKVDESQISIQPISADSGWNLSKDSYDTAKIRALNKRIAQNSFKNITSIVLIKNGELLLEEYFNGANRATLHDTRSVGKSFASTMMGIAIKEGHIKDEMLTLKDFYDLKKYDNYSANKEKVTIKHLLTMSSGFEGNDMDMESPGNEEKMYPTSDWVKFALDLPMHEQKIMGEEWAYFTAGAVILGDIIHQKVPGGLEKYTHEKLFEPLGIQNYQWQYTPQEVANTAGGLQMNSLDYAKYGQLYKNGGVWKDQQIIPQNWVDASLSQQIALPEDTGGGYYGYLFWNKTYEAGGKTYEFSAASGNGGNKIFVFKDLPLVVVITATAYGQPYGHVQVDKMMKDNILPAVINN